MIRKKPDTGRTPLNAKIYSLIAIALDETSILVAVYFSMQNIYQSCDLVRAVRRSNVHVRQYLVCLRTFAWRWSRIAMTLSAGEPPNGCSKPSVRQFLILNITKTNLPECRIIMDIWLINIKSKYNNWNHYIEVSSSDEKYKLSLM